MRARRLTAVASAVSLILEDLEPRRLFANPVGGVLANGVLTIYGSPNNDTFSIYVDTGNYNVVTNGGSAQLFAVANVNSVVIEAGDGGDWIFLHGTADPVQCNGGIGNDILTAGMGFGIAAVQGNVSFDGGAGSDRVDFRDDFGTTGRTVNASPTAISATGWANSFTMQSCDAMMFSGGSGGDTYNLAQLPAGMYADIYGNDGDDILNLAAGTLDTVAGQVYFTGGNGFDFAMLDDQTTARNDNYSVTATMVTRFSNGVAPFGGLEYYAEQLMLLAGAGDNQVSVPSTAAGPPGSSLWVQAGNGNDTLFAGTGNLDNLAAAVHWDGNGGTDAVKINDGSANSPRNFTVTNSSVTLSGNGTTFGGVYYAITPTPETIELTGPTSSFLDNTFRVNSTAAGQTLTITAGTGDDTFILGGGSPVSGAGAMLDNLAGAVVINGGTGGGGGGGGGGGATFDAITLSDVGNSLNQAFTISASAVTRQGWTGSLTFFQMEQLVLRAGDGNNAIHVQSITGGTTSVTVFGGGGNDDIDLAQNFQDLTLVAGNHVFYGGSGNDTLKLYNNLYNHDCVWSITPGQVVRSPENNDPSGTFAYEEMESLTLLAGQAGDSITVNDTFASTAVTISPGVDGPFVDDSIYVMSSQGPTPVAILPNNGGAGNGTSVNVNLDGTGTAAVRFPQGTKLYDLFVYNGGSASVPGGANALLNVTNSLVINPQGRLDLTDNDLAVNYTAASPIGSWSGSAYSGLTGQIQRAHNGGAWNGLYGITTSSPLAGSGLTTLAIAEARDVLSISGSQTGVFDGATVDATAVLIKYTYAGDVNFDGQVSGDDYASIDFGILVPGTRGYANGDFNFDGLVTSDDYSTIDFAILAQGGPL